MRLTKMQLKILPAVGVLAALVALVQGGTIIEHKFDTKMGYMVSNNGLWEWDYRNNMGYTVPLGDDGFAVMSSTDPSGDLMYDPRVDLQYGLYYFIRFHIAAGIGESTTFKLYRVSPTGEFISGIPNGDYSLYADPSNNQWFEVSETLPASAGSSRLGVYCATTSNNSNAEGILYGCAVDYIYLDSDDPNINLATTAPPVPTTDAPTTSVATTQAPTTERPITDYTVNYDFESGTQRWVLGRSNGAIWQRVPCTNYTNVEPQIGDNCLEVFPVDIYSGTVLAMSPRLVVGPLGQIKLTVEFFMDASWEFPVFLKLRRRLSFVEFDDEPAINLDTFGDQYNKNWMSWTDTYTGLTPGEEFNLILEGGLGILNNENSVAVNRILVEGAAEVEYDEVSFFDFNDGLVGWQSGASDGGKWVALTYDSLDPDWQIPEPSSGRLLMVERYDIHSGIITIESPPINASPMTAKQIQTRFWINGTLEYPVHFRVGLKTLDGFYDTPPFLDLSEYGNSLSQDWMELEGYRPIPVDPKVDYFQLVIEVDLGANDYNRIAIDRINISTTQRLAEYSEKPIVLGYNPPKPIEEKIYERHPDLDKLVIRNGRAEDFSAEYNFTTDTQGWVLGRSNGAAWQRVISGYDNVEPFEGQSYILQVFDTDVVSGTTVAMSPRLVVGPTKQIELTVEFYIKATKDYPAFLKVRRRLSFSNFDDEAAMNLDAYGDQYNSRWLRFTRVFGGLTEGEEFNLIIEAGLGADNKANSIAVSRVSVKGAKEVDYEEDTFFDFNNGLVGWQSGSNDGGKWISIPYVFVNPNLGVPVPSSGQVLMVDRYDIHSGIQTIESPPIPITARSAKSMQIRFWIKGSPVYPVSFRMGLKSTDGYYDAMPFLDLFQYGNSDSQNWQQLEGFVSIPANPKDDFFQLVLEVDLGGDLNNQIAIDNINVITIER